VFFGLGLGEGNFSREFTRIYANFLVGRGRVL